MEVRLGKRLRMSLILKSDGICGCGVIRDSSPPYDRSGGQRLGLMEKEPGKRGKYCTHEITNI